MLVPTTAMVLVAEMRFGLGERVGLAIVDAARYGSIWWFEEMLKP